jgi:hypothetical protein
MIIYKFLPELYALSAIAMRRLKVSRINELNDPFELMAADLLDHRKLAAVKELKDQLNHKKAIISFSNSWRDPLLWGHYADSHRGMALGFEVPDDENFLWKVRYRRKRFPIKWDAEVGQIVNGSDVIKGLIRTKYKDWKYEGEYRMFVGLNECENESSKYFYDFRENFSLKEVWVGLNCVLSVSRVIDLLNSNLSYVRVKKVGMHRREFKMVEDRAARIPKT